MALAYYRYERIVQDIAAFCQELLLTEEARGPRAGVQVFYHSFLPDREVELAMQADNFLAT